MATAIQKALQSPKAQAAIRGRAAAIARQKTEEAVKAVRERMRKAAPVLRRDVLEAYLLPAAAGAGGAMALDMAAKVVGPKVGAGARGDVVKTAVAIAVGHFGRKAVRTPWLQHAAIGAATVNLYNLAARVMNRAKAGTLNGLMTESHNMDLAGYPGMVPVAIHTTDGQVLNGLQGVDGSLYDSDGRLVPMLAGPEGGDALAAVDDLAGSGSYDLAGSETYEMAGYQPEVSTL
ncbi:MAG: hypothetical protein C0434_12855 [Xanthomonadaceae bacterium]|nr:hypothetical protein [Xanthomonadaceae bacterium]